MYNLAFHIMSTHHIYVPCDICLLPDCESCQKGYFYIVDCINLARLNKCIENCEIGIKKLMIFVDCKFSFSSLPSCNVESVYGYFINEIQYPFDIVRVFNIIQYSGDETMFNCLPITLKNYLIEFCPKEIIPNMVISNLPPNLQTLTLHFNYTTCLCGINLNDLPDSIECITFITSYLQDPSTKPIYLNQLYRLPSQLKKIVIDLPTTDSMIFSNASRIDMESKGRCYLASGENQCVDVFTRYCQDNNIELIYESY